MQELERLRRRLDRIQSRLDNTDRAAAYRSRFRGKKREWVWSFKRKPCEDCGVKYPPYVMQFDHRDPSTKKFNISQADKHTRAEILEEIAKCDVVCANCHAVRTFERMLQDKFDRWEAE